MGLVITVCFEIVSPTYNDVAMLHSKLGGCNFPRGCLHCLIKIRTVAAGGLRYLLVLSASLPSSLPLWSVAPSANFGQLPVCRLNSEEISNLMPPPRRDDGRGRGARVASKPFVAIPPNPTRAPSPPPSPRSLEGIHVGWSRSSSKSDAEIRGSSSVRSFRHSETGQGQDRSK